MTDAYYDKVWEIMKLATDDFIAAGIPKHEIPPALADYLILSVLAMGRENGLSEQAAEAIIERQKNLLEDWRQGKSPFDKMP